MFNLNTASLAVRKAAALEGIRSGQFEPVSNPQGHSHEDVVARVTNGKRTIELTRTDVDYAGQLPWSDVNRK